MSDELVTSLIRREVARFNRIVSFIRSNPDCPSAVLRGVNQIADRQLEPCNSAPELRVRALIELDSLFQKEQKAIDLVPGMSAELLRLFTDPVVSAEEEGEDSDEE